MAYRDVDTLALKQREWSLKRTLLRALISGCLYMLLMTLIRWYICELSHSMIAVTAIPFGRVVDRFLQNLGM